MWSGRTCVHVHGKHAQSNPIVLLDNKYLLQLSCWVTVHTLNKGIVYLPAILQDCYQNCYSLQQVKEICNNDYF